MKLYCDFHIHTSLSPCGDNDMTPNNIINMSKLKGLDIIAITDHNSCENVPACVEVGNQVGVKVIPGMELQTSEEVHVICLFKNIDSALEFQNIVYSHLPELHNNPQIFGEQNVMDSEDNVLTINNRMLLTSTSLSFDESFKIVQDLDGVFIPAHIDRQSYSVIFNIGFIPDYLPIYSVEYHSKTALDKLLMSGIVKHSYNFIHSSDAHYLEDILEKEQFIDIQNFSISAIIEYLRK